MVIAPASTGSDRTSRKAVTSTDQAKSGILCKVMPGARMLKIVVMKLIAPRIDDAPARWIDRMAKSIAGPGCPVFDESGGYMTQPPPNPSMPGAPSTNIEIKSSVNDAGNSQNEMLFMRGNAMSGAPIIKRHEPIAETADQRRHDHEEDHDQAVRGDEHVVHVLRRVGRLRGICMIENARQCRENFDARIGELGAHGDRQCAADNAGDDREDQIDRADVFVVRRKHVAPPAGRMGVLFVVTFDDGCHFWFFLTKLERN